MPVEEEGKKTKVQHYDRDIICIPDEYDASGKFRAKLASSGLVGKLFVEDEICSVFSKPMGGRMDFPFIYLQATGAGSRTLTAPNSSFSITIVQVDCSTGSDQAVYIMAKDKLIDMYELSVMKSIIMKSIKIIAQLQMCL